MYLMYGVWDECLLPLFCNKTKAVSSVYLVFCCWVVVLCQGFVCWFPVDWFMLLGCVLPVLLMFCVDVSGGCVS